MKNLNNPNDNENSGESFDDLASMKICSTDGLEQFEICLEDKSYYDRFVRYLNFKYTSNGCQNGNSFFLRLFRDIIDKQMLLPYSWAGISCGAQTNIGFQNKHSIFGNSKTYSKKKIRKQQVQMLKVI